MAHAFDVEVVAADRKVYSGPAESLVIPGTDGYLGVLRGHAPLISAMKIGEVTITQGEGRQPIEIAVSGGFVEVMPDRVIILADTAETAEEIDIERAKMAVERAEERLRAAVPDIDFDRAQAALMRALNRLRVANRRTM